MRVRDPSTHEGDPLPAQSVCGHSLEASSPAGIVPNQLHPAFGKPGVKSPKGMLVKARIAAVDPAAVSTVDDLEHALEGKLEIGHIIGLFLILDVLHMNKDDA
jgi:hypothetical protein